MAGEIPDITGDDDPPLHPVIDALSASIGRYLAQEVAATPRPIRIQLRRTKGWRMPENTVKVTRGLGRSGRFGNPFVPLEFDEKTVRVCVDAYRKLLTAPENDVLEMGAGGPGRGAFLVAHRRNILAELPELRGKNLACWCALDAPCHADVLLELANG